MIQRFGATPAALSTLASPMAAAVIGTALGEVLTPPLLVGAALILGGVFLAER